MRLSKSRDDDKYVLTFEISPAEAAAGGVDMRQLWQSKSLAEFVIALSKMTKQAPPPNEPFEEKLRRARAAFGGVAYQQQQQYQSPFEGAFNQAFGQKFGSQFNSTRTPPEPEWAKTLGVKATATKDEIKARYRVLAKENHPDRGGDPAKFAKISEAYEQATK